MWYNPLRTRWILAFRTLLKAGGHQTHGRTNFDENEVVSVHQIESAVAVNAEAEIFAFSDSTSNLSLCLLLDLGRSGWRCGSNPEDNGRLIIDVRHS